MVNGLLDNLLFTFIVVKLLVEFFLLVMVLTIFQVVFDLFRDFFNTIIIVKLFCYHNNFR